MKKGTLYWLTCLLCISPALKAEEVSGQRYTTTLQHQKQTGGDGILVHYSLSNQQLYPDSDVLYTFSVESSADVNLSSIQPPSADGVSVRRVNQDHDYYFVGSEQYRVSSYQFALSANMVGDFELKGASVTHRKVDSDGHTQSVSLEAESIPMTSMAIPEQYRGLWLPSQFVSIEQEWSSHQLELEVGESLTRTIVLFIQGVGIDAFPKMEIANPNAVNVYSKPPVLSERDGGTSVTIEQTLVPRLSGELVLPTLSIPWFNLKDNTIQVATAKGVTLNITALPNDTQLIEAPLLTNENMSWSAQSWRAIAIGIIVLWFMTLGVCYRVFRRLQALTSKPMTGVNLDTETLYQAVKQDNATKVAYLWAHESDELKVTCREAFDQYVATRFSRIRSNQCHAKTVFLDKLKTAAATKSTRKVVPPKKQSLKARSLNKLVPEFKA